MAVWMFAVTLLSVISTTRAQIRRPAMRSSLPQILQEHPHDRPSIVNCTWRYFEQKLDHFGNAPGTFKQRYCLYTGFWNTGHKAGFKVSTSVSGPIFFYTGNESPVEVYVNNTGLMWEMGKRKGAMLVFAEHRYEPSSHPRLDDGVNCFAYCTSAQALADYKALIDALRVEFSAHGSPVVAFGGSYGGMLAGWFRIKYPDVIAGSIAGSAPVWGLATTLKTERLDWTSRAISRGVSKFGGSSDMCLSNLKSAWPLIEEIAKTKVGLQLLSKAAKSCRPLTSAKNLTAWAQSPWFMMAEGNYPFSSTYITFAVGPGYFPLPAWPMREACKSLSQDFGVEISGSVENVTYRLRIGDVQVDVDWDQATGNGEHLTESQIKRSGVLRLIEGVADAVGVWYNVSKQKTCFEIDANTPNAAESAATQTSSSGAAVSLELDAETGDSCAACPPCEGCGPCPVSRCEYRNKSSTKDLPKCSFKGKIANTFAWDGVTCNEDMQLYNTNVQGTGRDLFWPPNVARNTTVDSLVGSHKLQPGCAKQFDAQGLLGAPDLSDPWSGWMTSYYGGANISHHRNIIWSNGALDPWSGAGVYPPNGGPEGPLLQNISADGSQVALVIDLGGHHLDLFFADENDPDSVKKARQIEEDMVTAWCQEWYDSRVAEDLSIVI